MAKEAVIMDRYELLVPERMAAALREANEARLRRAFQLARRGCDSPLIVRVRRRIGELLISAGTALAESPTRRRRGHSPLDRPA